MSGLKAEGGWPIRIGGQEFATEEKLLSRAEHGTFLRSRPPPRRLHPQPLASGCAYGLWRRRILGHPPHSARLDLRGSSGSIASRLAAGVQTMALFLAHTLWAAVASSCRRFHRPQPSRESTMPESKPCYITTRPASESSRSPLTLLLRRQTQPAPAYKPLTDAGLANIIGACTLSRKTLQDG